MVTPDAGREMATHLTTQYKVSERRACRVVGINRATMRYRPSRKPELVEVEAAVESRLVELARERPRFGYRRLGVLLRREGLVANHKRVYRLYKKDNLALRRKNRKRLAAASRVPPHQPARANQVWAMDFMHDTLVDGRKFRTLNIVDVFTRECRAIEVDTSLGGQRVVRILERLREEHGAPERLMMDNGPEFTGKALDAWAYSQKVELEFIRPGKPMENGHIESFNSKFRDECLNSHWFMSMEDARHLIEEWRCDYNEARPHSSLGQLTPADFARACYELCESHPRVEGA
jgi:putative transposase